MALLDLASPQTPVIPLRPGYQTRNKQFADRLVFFFFQKKKQNAFVLLRRKLPKKPRRANVFGSFFKKEQTSMDRGLNNLSTGILLFLEKEAKSFCSASQKVTQKAPQGQCYKRTNINR
jgi:hypothetical protein